MVLYLLATKTFGDLFFARAMISSLSLSSLLFPGLLGRPTSLGFALAAFRPSMVLLEIKSLSISAAMPKAIAKTFD